MHPVQGFGLGLRCGRWQVEGTILGKWGKKKTPKQDHRSWSIFPYPFLTHSHKAVVKTELLPYYGMRKPPYDSSLF